MRIQSNLKPRDYTEKEVCRIINPKQRDLYIKHRGCTIFVAKHPVTKPNLNVIHRSETKLEEKIDELMKTALETVEIIEID